MPRGKYERPIYNVVCSDCGEEYTQRRKPVDNPRCKKCQKRYHDRKYNETHKEENAERNRKYRENNKEKIRDRDKAYRLANKEKISAKRKVYYENNKEHILDYQEKRRRKLGVKARALSVTEQQVLTYLTEIFPQYSISCLDRKTIKNPNTNAYMELDFYIKELNLAIEINGATHYTPIYGKPRLERQQRNDALKRELCKQQGITLVEIPLDNGKHYDRFESEQQELRALLQAHLLKYKGGK